MRHTSIKVETPCEFINITPLNPLISKCEIKVCYVGDNPNRNRSIITKDVAREMANSLPGSPIVGYYNETSEDFEEHNRIIDISNGQCKLRDTTKPYGFVDLNAKVWFQKFVDDGVNEHEYLMTEGYLWTGQYPETKRILEKGNNQSMELDNNFLDGTWTKDNNGNPQFFIINEAIISKLCILGDETEPCFEGSTITEPTVQFSFDDGFKNQLFSMMNELKELIKEGGTPVFNTYAVEIGNALWNALYDFIEAKFPRDLEPGEVDGPRCSKYYIESVWEEASQKFVILRDRKDTKLYRMNFSWSDDGFSADGTLTEVKQTYVPVSEENKGFSLEDAENFELNRYPSQDKTDEGNTDNSNNTLEGENNFTENSENEPAGSVEQEVETKPTADHTEEPSVSYTLEEIPEYVELNNKYSALETDFNNLKAEKEALENEILPLKQFKAASEKKDKENMINSFYMLSDEDKAEVVANIDTYSLDEIEAKLSVICFRNKVSFDLDKNDNQDEETNPTVYNLNGGDVKYNDAPDWVKAAIAVSEKRN